MIADPVTTITLTAGTPQSVKFASSYPFYWIDNKTSGNVYARIGGTPAPDSDGTFTIAAGSQLRVSGGAFDNDITLLGSGKVQIIASELASCPFKLGAKGGGNELSGASSYSVDAVDYPLLGFNLYGKSVQDGTPSPDAPVDIVSVGENGFDIITKDDTHFNLLSVRDNGKGIITKQPVSAVGKNGETKQFIVSASGSVLTYQWWQNVNDGKGWVIIDTVGARTSTYTIPVAAFRDGYKYRCVITDNNGNSETSNEATLYVVSADCEIKTASIATDALPWCGIPVSEGGNYTDSNGQQWICDELIYNADGTGKIVKRTGKIIFDGSDDESWNTQITGTSGKYQFSAELSNIYPITTGNTAPNMYCDRYAVLTPNGTWNLNRGITTVKLSTGSTVIYIYDSAANNDTATFKSMLAVNPVTVVYQLDTPQEIELTAAEVAALKTLQTFDGVTNISNSAGAEMSVKYCTNKALSEYVLPITKGLQKQIDELRAAVLSLGGNV